MSKSANSSKVKAAKTTKQNKILIIGACSLIMAAVLGLALFSAATGKNAEIYGYYGQTVQLLENGNFFAILAHSARKSGTYTKTAENGRIAVLFNVNGSIQLGWIINNALHIPPEWDDGHGHGSIFPRVN